MTVRSANYSSLDEVWGEAFNPSNKPKKEKRKKIVDPICDLYQMGNNSGYSDNDLVSYANNYFEKYDKTPYNRTINDHVNIHEDTDVLPKQYRERPVRQVTVSDDRETYDVSEVDDVPFEQEPKFTQHQSASNQQAKEQFFASRYYNDDDEEPENTTTNFAFIDLLLYVISGIILIFVMEQFVKIGLLLQ